MADDKSNITTGDLVAGGGAGGALVFLINTYVQDPKSQTLLLYLAPTFSIFITKIYSFATDQAVTQWSAWVAERKRKDILRRAREGLIEAKSQLRAIESDGAATSEHKITARDRVQKFEQAVLELNAKDIVSIT